MELIVDHYECPVNKGQRADRVSSGRYVNPRCGDTVTVELLADGAIWWHGSGCVVSMGSASILADLGRRDISPAEFLAAVCLTDPVKRDCILTPWLALQNALSVSLRSKLTACKGCANWAGLCVPMGKLCEVEKVWQTKREPIEQCPHAELMRQPLKISERQ